MMGILYQIGGQMDEKSTKELENVLGSTHLKDFDTYCKENKEKYIE